MPIKLHWSTIIFFGATFNVFVNYGYKILSVSVPVAWVGAFSLFVTSLVLGLYGLYTRRDATPILREERLIWIVLMGLGTTISFSCFLLALKIGPLSLVDPLWACVYSIVSIILGMCIVRERPNAISLTGIVLYLIGAALMSQG